MSLLSNVSEDPYNILHLCPNFAKSIDFFFIYEAVCKCMIVYTINDISNYFL